MAKLILHKIKKENLLQWWITLFKVYYAMVIKAKELQQEVKGFWNIRTGDHMRDTSNSVPGTSILRRGKMGDE